MPRTVETYGARASRQSVRCTPTVPTLVTYSGGDAIATCVVKHGDRRIRLGRGDRNPFHVTPNVCSDLVCEGDHPVLREGSVGLHAAQSQLAPPEGWGPKGLQEAAYFQ
jgi:hypothetical protein